MKKLMFLLVWMCTALAVYAQLTVSKECTLMQRDLTALQLNDRQPVVINGERIPFAIVKVGLAESGVVFDSKWVLKQEFKDNEYWVYLADGTASITIKSKLSAPLHYSFPEPVSARSTYVMTVLNEYKHKSEIITGTVDADDFSQILAQGDIVVNYRVGPNVSVRYSAPESLLSHLSITCEGDVLTCSLDNYVETSIKGAKRLDAKKVVIDVVSDVLSLEVNSFTASYGATINATSKISAKELSVCEYKDARVNIMDAVVGKLSIDADDGAHGKIYNLKANSINVNLDNKSTFSIDGSLGYVIATSKDNSKLTLSGTIKDLSASLETGGNVDYSKAKIINKSTVTTKSVEYGENVKTSVSRELKHERVRCR